MKNAWGRFVIFTTLLLSCVLCISPRADAGDAPAAELKVGAAAVELHADDELPIAGGIGPGKATGQDGLLRAVATVIQGPPDDTKVAIVALDILMIRRDYLDEAVKMIEQKTGIPFDHIIINCTHTHHAPSTVKIHGYDVIPEFAEQVRDAIVQAVVEAHDKMAASPPARMHFIMGREATVGQNSRMELSDGTISWGIHPDMEMRPTGPFDPDFPVLAFKRSGPPGAGSSLASVIFGHSTHTIGTRHLGRRSPAFYGLAAQAFEQETGAVTTFVQGASGSTHLWKIDNLKFPDVWIEAERRILNALRYHVDQAPQVLVNRIGSLKREVTVKVRNFDEEKEEAAVSYYTRKHHGERAEFTAGIFRQMRAELAPYKGEERKTWISATRIGDVAIVGVPAEFFTQLGIDIKKRSPFRHTIIAELANDYIGYVGNADAYRLGGYQLWMGHHSWTERGTGELFVDTAVELLDQLYRQ